MQFPENQEAEEAFGEWVEEYKHSMSDGTFAWHFLSADHLRDAFMAGLLAGSGNCPAREGR